MPIIPNKNDMYENVGSLNISKIRILIKRFKCLFFSNLQLDCNNINCNKIKIATKLQINKNQFCFRVTERRIKKGGYYKEKRGYTYTITIH